MASEPTGAAVVIIGGGVTGLSAGWWLARAGVDVLVIESGIVGWEASGRNGGGTTHHFSPLFKEEQRLWPQMDHLLGYPTEFSPYRIRIAFDAEQLAAHECAAENARRQGFESERLDRKQLLELVPIAASDHLGALFYRFGGHANPHRTVQAYAWAIEDLGGRVLQRTSATGIVTKGTRVVAVETTRGAFACDFVVIAAGTRIDSLAAMCGVDVPIVSARTEIVATEPVSKMAYGGVDGNGLYGRQTLRGNLVYGGGPHQWLPSGAAIAGQPRPTALIQNIARRLAHLFPGVRHARLLRGWSGIVENTPDGRPIIDRLSTLANVVVATMSSVGFGLSPASGRAVAELVQFGECRFADIASFRLSRFSNLEPDWRERRGWLPSPATAVPSTS